MGKKLSSNAAKFFQVYVSFVGFPSIYARLHFKHFYLYKRELKVWCTGLHGQHRMRRISGKV